MDPLKAAQALTQYGPLGAACILIALLAGAVVVLFFEVRSSHARERGANDRHNAWMVEEIGRRIEMEQGLADAIEVMSDHAKAELDAHKVILEALLGARR